VNASRPGAMALTSLWVLGSIVVDKMNVPDIPVKVLLDFCAFFRPVHYWGSFCLSQRKEGGSIYEMYGRQCCHPPLSCRAYIPCPILLLCSRFSSECKGYASIPALFLSRATDVLRIFMTYRRHIVFSQFIFQISFPATLRATAFLTATGTLISE
jgi:hypothetical protein